ITVLNPEHFGKKEAVSSWGWPDVTESWTWPGFEGRRVRLDIYSRAQEVEIFINGKSIGRRAVPDSWILQTDIVYEPGIIEVAEYYDGIKGFSSRLETAKETAALKAVAEKNETADVIVLTIEAVDEEGRRVPNYAGTVSCQLDKNLILVGMGSADPVSEDNYTLGKCRLFQGRALLIVKKTAEEEACIEVSAEDTAVQKAVVTI
ncbi:MAG: DUF4982 domain-containing protein, partial [Lachnospiraceae bacterium]|nr:DUF4982 domain-containing protein [Lachnospiraceae bacterium]